MNLSKKHQIIRLWHTCTQVWNLYFVDARSHITAIIEIFYHFNADCPRLYAKIPSSVETPVTSFLPSVP